MSALAERVNRIPMAVLVDAAWHAVSLLFGVIVAVISWRTGRHGLAVGAVFFSGASFGIVWFLIVPRLWPPPPRHRRPRGARR